MPALSYPAEKIPTVRELLRDGNWEALQKKVPESTFRYFTSEKAAPVLQRLREAGEVRHY